MASKAMAHLDLALRMSSHDPQNVRIYMALAAAHYAAGRFTEAVGYGRQAVQQRQGFSGGHRIYVASLAQDGQIDEARTAANDCLAAKLQLLSEAKRTTSTRDEYFAF